MPAVEGQSLGWRLTTLFGNAAVRLVVAPKPVLVPKKKRTLLPLLTLLFMASYGLMTLLIVEQGSTIQSQRNLIQVLLSDSRQLWALKGRALSDKLTADKLAQSQTKRSSTQTPLSHAQTPSTQTQSTKTPSTQIPSTQTPSTKVPRHHAPSRAGKSAKPYTQVPPMPASDLGDQRRELITL
ncbi:MAG: hypothetical protein WBM24_13615 [Candidatus Sulfotelmatobacter sp.]